MKKATLFTAVFGVVSGYDELYPLYPINPYVTVSQAWMASMDEERERSGLIIGATVTSSRRVYPIEFGCPGHGESVAMVIGNSNPKFVSDLEAFKEAVIRVVASTKARLEQSRVQLTFTDVSDFVYFEPEGDLRW